MSYIIYFQPNAVAQFQSKSALPAARGITTTDRYPKLRSYRSKSGSWSIVGIAKGAGMIEPNLATMLAYIMTDLDIPRDLLQESLSECSRVSFNSITVDGDQSTSDTVLALSSQSVKIQNHEEEISEFKTGLLDICQGLAEDIVRNGEGTQHVVRVTVSAAPSTHLARDLGRFIINSNLVKCAIAGSDPNVGRIVGAIGSYLSTTGATTLLSSAGVLGTDLMKGLSVTLGGINIFSDSSFQLDPNKELLLSNYMFDAQLYPADLPEHDRNYPPHYKSVEIVVSLGGGGKHSCVVIGSDLTKEYVEVNADYRS